ncbi:MAG TPA: type II secretion system protein [Candidatus Saccharimonadales bacterium]|nr:type II secretion system protein [Candidatus Saccharimonadales bacterium]
MKRVRPLDQQGFTIPELLVALGMVLGLCVGAYYVLRPQSFDPQTRDAQRMVGASQLMVGLEKYYADNGHLPTSITSKKKVVGSDKDSANLCTDLVPKYMKDLPLDPTWGVEIENGGCSAKNQQYIASYLVSATASGGHTILYVAAPMAEGSSIHLQRTL